MTQQAQEVVLRISRGFGAPLERGVRRTNPGVLLDWWRAGPHSETPTAEVDLRLTG